MGLSKRMQDLTVEDAKVIARLLSYCCKVALTINFSKENLVSVLLSFVDQLKTTSKPLEFFAAFDHSKAKLDQEKLDEIRDSINGQSDWMDL